MAKKTADQWFQEYGESHKNPINKLIHWVCVPLIYLVIFGLLWEIPQPDWMYVIPGFNWATLGAFIAMLFYWRLSSAIAKGMIAFTLICFSIIIYYEVSYSTPLWIPSLVAFALLWIGQFIGHHIEGKKPSFIRDIQFLLIGPAWLLGFIYRVFKIKYD